VANEIRDVWKDFDELAKFWTDEPEMSRKKEVVC
jgi:hypothetical protein